MRSVALPLDYDEVLFTYEYDCTGFQMPGLTPNRMRATVSRLGLSCVVDGPAYGVDMRNMCYSRLMTLWEERCPKASVST